MRSRLKKNPIKNLDLLKFKGKKVSDLFNTEKDELLEILCRKAGLL